MKAALTLIVTLIGMGVFAQESDTAYYYGTRWYNSSPCGSCPLPEEPPKEGNFIKPYQFSEMKPIMLDSLPENLQQELLRPKEPEVKDPLL